MATRPTYRSPLRLMLVAAIAAVATTGCSSCDDPDPGPGDGSTDARVIPPGCGDGTLTSGESCDDANNDDGDGCSFDCADIDPHYLCPTPGRACIRVVTCGNGRIEGDETCDDRNVVATDGCDADCHKQDGWTCAPVGVACVATECGDGIVAGFESCDDGDVDDDDGCSASCELEDGYYCPTPGADCDTTTCGDSVTQGTEHCDDGNPEVGDGCDPLCHREPNCAGGTCVAVCGDGVKWAPEACDDGNTVSGDGCTADCSAVEQGFSCVEQPLPPPSSIELPVTYRDFLANCFDTVLATSNTADARLAFGQAGAVAPYGHPDFDCFNGADGAQTDGNLPDLDMVQPNLDSAGKPVLGTETGVTASAASFAQWYRTTANVNLAIARTLPLDSIGGGSYQFADTTFFPITDDGWALVDCNPTTAGLQPCEGTRNYSGGQRFFFTSEAHFWFEYQGDGSEVLTFLGDDDVWVFIDGKLVVDIGGVHGPVSRTLDLDDYVDNCDGIGDPAYCEAPIPLEVGKIYEGIVFQAERHVGGSNYTLTLTGFTQAPSICTDSCGDTVVSSREACDLGANNGMGDGSAYGGCTTSCTFESYCGDGVIDGGFGETCDDGINLGGEASACAPGCMSTGAVCGDGVTQIGNGEQCDDGNVLAGDGCDEQCIFEIE